MRTLLELMALTILCGLMTVLGLVCSVRWAVRRVRRAVGTIIQQALHRRPASATLPRNTSVTRDPKRVASAARVYARAVVPGAGRGVAVVRRDLQRDLAATGRAVVAAQADGRPVASLAMVIGNLREQAQAADVDLLVVAAEPDPEVRSRLLADQAERVALLKLACAQVRRGLLLAGEATAAPLLAGVLEELDDEVIALGLRAAAHRQLIRL